jgi:F0F1-type ATP synthase membrane subunit b/b'
MKEVETQERMISEARSEAEALMKKTRSEIKEQIDQAHKEVSQFTPQLTSAIVDKLLEKGQS